MAMGGSLAGVTSARGCVGRTGEGKEGRRGNEGACTCEVLELWLSGGSWSSSSISPRDSTGSIGPNGLDSCCSIEMKCWRNCTCVCSCCCSLRGGAVADQTEAGRSPQPLNGMMLSDGGNEMDLWPYRGCGV